LMAYPPMPAGSRVGNVNEFAGGVNGDIAVGTSNPLKKGEPLTVVNAAGAGIDGERGDATAIVRGVKETS